MTATYYYVRHNVELGEATRECDCRNPCQKVVKAEDYDALAAKLGAIHGAAKLALIDNGRVNARVALEAIRDASTGDSDGPR